MNNKIKTKTPHKLSQLAINKMKKHFIIFLLCLLKHYMNFMNVVESV